MDRKLTDRWIALYVENEVGVLAKVSGLFSGKSYNLKSLTVGTTERDDVSRMTIEAESDDITFEQIKKQLNTMVEVIKVIDLTEVKMHMNEIMYAVIPGIDSDRKAEVFRIAQVFHLKPIDIDEHTVMLLSSLAPDKNDDLVALLKRTFHRIEITRGGAVAVESLVNK
jgi:acetolactate synthase-1/3 small subunit